MTKHIKDKLKEIKGHSNQNIYDAVQKKALAFRQSAAQMAYYLEIVSRDKKVPQDIADLILKLRKIQSTDIKEMPEAIEELSQQFLRLDKTYFNQFNLSTQVPALQRAETQLFNSATQFVSHTYAHLERNNQIANNDNEKSWGLRLAAGLGGLICAVAAVFIGMAILGSICSFGVGLLFLDITVPFLKAVAETSVELFDYALTSTNNGKRYQEPIPNDQEPNQDPLFKSVLGPG